MEHEPRRTEESFPWIPAVIITAFIIVGVYFIFQREQAPEAPATPQQQQEVPKELKVPEHPKIQYPIGNVDNTTGQETTKPEPGTVNQTPVETVPPAPAKSLTESLQELLGSYFDELIIPDELVRRFVVTIDNMTAAKLPQRYSFTKPPKGKFAIKQKPDGTVYLDPANYARYTPYVELFEKVDLKQLVSIYRHNYPAFQQAYADLGYPDWYFNDRLVAIINHLLKAPDVSGDIDLVQPKVYYEYADRNLEELTAGKKIMVRMGPDNERRVKARLQELRQLLIAYSQH